MTTKLTGRIIAIKHNRKKETNPTRVAIFDDKKIIEYDLGSMTDERDFVLCEFPVAWQKIGEWEAENGPVAWFDADTPKGFKPHHCKWKKIKKEKVVSFDAQHVITMPDKDGKPVYMALEKVPVEFEGLKQGDDVVTISGGSGGFLTIGMSERGEKIGARVFVTPPRNLKLSRPPKKGEENGKQEKSRDHLVILYYYRANPTAFYQVLQRDRDVIKVAEMLRLRQDQQKARIGCNNRIFSRLEAKYLTGQGLYQYGTVEDAFRQAKASDKLLAAFVDEENALNKNLQKVVEATKLWQIFADVKGCGARIAAGIIATVQDIKRFENSADPPKRKALKVGARVRKMCEIAINDEGRFPRRPNPCEAKQALYQFGQQLMRQKGKTFWSQKLLWKKAELKKVHPEPVEVEVAVPAQNGEPAYTKKVKKFTPIHLQRMAIWWTLNKFMDWVVKEWLKIEDEQK